MKRVILRQLRGERFNQPIGVSLVRSMGLTLDELRAIVFTLDRCKLHTLDAARFEIARVVDGVNIEEEQATA